MIYTLKEFLDSRSPEELTPKVINFLMSGKPINGDSLDALAAEHQLDRDKIDSVLYKLLEDFFHNGKYQQKIKKGESPVFDEVELNKGRKHELEHTSGPIIAELIAKDHLVEDPKYYTKIEKMEKDLL